MIDLDHTLEIWESLLIHVEDVAVACFLINGVAG